MTLLYLHHDRIHRSSATSRHSFRQVGRRIGAAFRTIHATIAAAKIYRLRNELMLHAGTFDDWARPRGHTEAAARNSAQYPQRPLHLGEKWDF